MKKKKQKKKQSKIKPIKIGKELGTTHCIGCKFQVTKSKKDK